MRGELDVQAIFLAGKNEELRAEAETLATTAKFPVKVIGYSDEIEKLMQSANVMISKLGGLTTFEALACRLPIIADATTPPMPQESGAATDRKRGAGVLLKRASDIVPVVRRMVEDSRYYAACAPPPRACRPRRDAPHRRRDHRAPPRDRSPAEAKSAPQLAKTQLTRPDRPSTRRSVDAPSAFQL